MLHKVLVEYLQVRGGKSNDYLFCTSYGERIPRTTLQMGITKYAKRRGVFRYSLHLFRHTFATLFLREGGDIYTLKRLLGHSSYRMTEYYLHLAGKDLNNCWYYYINRIFITYIDTCGTIVNTYSRGGLGQF
ncbi:tyrosine-type recombinase/integrase [Clostridium sp. HBUAS56017]|uniref:tyrosine-type recombinase/integrase n=1 Tax=Clostridium sp. HBUAS56017 TaxID=2571128 RepID=UPI00163D7622|nr:tyrosine-type recombinase/integrase [Clostridium sp. HBUAS56017]